MKQRRIATISIRNKQARDYIFRELYTAGLQLSGFQAKAIKNHEAELTGSSIVLSLDEAWLVGAQFGPGFLAGSESNAVSSRQKLLLKKRELVRLQQTKNQKLRMVPIRFFVRHGYVKLEIGIGSITTKHDKRQVLKAKEMQRNTRHFLEKR